MALPDLPPPSSAGQDAQALVLIAEDEPEIAEILTAYLARGGLRTVHAADGRRALELHLQLKPDLVLLDVQMPHVDGWKVLAEIRHRGDTPVIMLTALDQDIDKLTGLRIGADDYVVKPFNPAEVVARAQAVLRRSMAGSRQEEQRVLRVAPFEIDLEHHEATLDVNGERHTLVLTLTEFKLLAQLARAAPRVQPRRADGHLPAGRRRARTHGGQPRQQAAQEAGRPRRAGRARQRARRRLQALELT